MITVDKYWFLFLQFHICSEETMTVATKLNGYTVETLLDILYVLKGVRTWQDYLDTYGY